jgi:hypothetical protein
MNSDPCCTEYDPERHLACHPSSRHGSLTADESDPGSSTPLRREDAP